MSDLIKPKEFVVKDEDGVEKKFILSNFPAVAGREIVAKYVSTNMPKVGDYATSEEIMLKLMCYVAVDINGVLIRLNTQALVDNHCTDWEMLGKVEMAMMEKNCSFFRSGRHWDFLESLTQIFLSKLSGMLTPSSAPSSPEEKQPSTN